MSLFLFQSLNENLNGGKIQIIVCPGYLKSISGRFFVILMARIQKDVFFILLMLLKPVLNKIYVLNEIVISNSNISSIVKGYIFFPRNKRA